MKTKSKLHSAASARAIPLHNFKKYIKSTSIGQLKINKSASPACVLFLACLPDIYVMSNFCFNLHKILVPWAATETNALGPRSERLFGVINGGNLSNARRKCILTARKVACVHIENRGKILFQIDYRIACLFLISNWFCLRHLNILFRKSMTNNIHKIWEILLGNIKYFRRGKIIGKLREYV